jgi:hypothetical protein
VSTPASPKLPVSRRRSKEMPTLVAMRAGSRGHSATDARLARYPRLPLGQPIDQSNGAVSRRVDRGRLPRASVSKIQQSRSKFAAYRRRPRSVSAS